MLLKTIPFFVLVSAVCCGVIDNNVEDSCALPDKLREEIKNYQPVVDKIINSIVSGKYKGLTYNNLAKFIDTFGNRLTGTQNLENAIDYMLNTLKGYNLDNVHGEEVNIPVWIRGNESATLISPRRQNLRMLGLGLSVGTGPEGILAEAIVVNDFDELKKVGDKVRGKIVVYNEKYISYGKTVKYRGRGASEAAKYGAVAALVKSVTPFSLDTPHTGMQSYQDGVNKIPVACITREDSHMLKRMQDRGQKLMIHLKMDARNDPQKKSRNTVAEITGKQIPEQVVLVSGHLDSWDVGQGAMDDGGGAFISWNSLAILRDLGLTPRRTMRAVLWTGEEQGYVGAYQYVDRHLGELNNFNFVMESDIGTFTPVGLDFNGLDEAACIVKEVMTLLGGINATSFELSDDVSSDINLLVDRGIPGGSLWNKNEKYFWFHHSPADTMDAEDSDTLDLCTALWASVSYVIADLSVDLPKKLK